MTATPSGPGRTLPASSATQAGFLQEDATGQSENGTQWVTAADVLAALAEIDAVAEAAAGLGFTGGIFNITQDTHAKPGGTYLAANACTITMPNAITQDWAGNYSRALRQIQVVTTGAFTVTIAAFTSANHFNDTNASTTKVGYGVVASGAAKTFDTTGDGHIATVGQFNTGL